MSFISQTAEIAFIWFIGLLVFLEMGRRIGIALAKSKHGNFKGGGATEGAVFGLLGLLIAFTFSGAASRFEDRRHLITEEANAIGTAYLRLDLLNIEVRDSMRELFRRYLDVRIATFSNSEDVAATQAIFAEGAALQSTIWSKAVAESQQPGAAIDATKLLLPSLNEMFDITTTRLVATTNHPPKIVYILLAALSLVAALLAGNSLSGNPTRSWVHMIIFSTMISVTMFVVIDLEYPRHGLIRIDEADQVLIDLRASMR